MSLSHAIALAESVRRKVDSASHNSKHRAHSTEEITAGQVERKRVCSVLCSPGRFVSLWLIQAEALLKSTIATVEQSLAALRRSSIKGTIAKSASRRTKTTLRHTVAGNPAKLANGNGVRVAAASSDPALDNVLQQMSAGGLKPGADSLDDMATAIKPIIDKFDTVLVSDFCLENISSTEGAATMCRKLLISTLSTRR